jgi:hypothetical protein
MKVTAEENSEERRTPKEGIILEKKLNIFTTNLTVIRILQYWT